RRMEEERVLDRVAALDLDADDRGVRRLVLPVVQGPRVVDLEVEVHRADFLRPEAEFDRRLLVRLEPIDDLQPRHVDRAADDRGDALRRPVPLVRDLPVDAGPVVRLESRIRRREGLLRPPQVILDLTVALLLDRPFDLRQVRFGLARIEALALRDLDVVDQGRELDLDLLAGNLALLALEGLVQAELDLPHAFVLAFLERLFRFAQQQFRLARVRADP